MHNYNWHFLQFCVSVFFVCVSCFIKVKLSVKVKQFFSLLCVCAILPAKAVPKMTYSVSGGTLNPTHSLTDKVVYILCDCNRAIEGELRTQQFIQKTALSTDLSVRISEGQGISNMDAESFKYQRKWDCRFLSQTGCPRNWNKQNCSIWHSEVEFHFFACI